MMLATPAAARGLDLPAVAFIYSLGPPVDATDYLHRAGRAGRIGSPVDGALVLRFDAVAENLSTGSDRGQSAARS